MKFERARKTRDFLKAHADEPVAVVIEKAFARAGRSLQGVVDIENAIALLTDVELRERYAGAAWRYYDVLRSYSDDSLVPVGGVTWVVAVPFTVEAPEMLLGRSANWRGRLISEALMENFIKLIDPACPMLPPLLYVTPMSRATLVNMAAYGDMLANPKTNHPMMEFHRVAWLEASEAYQTTPGFVPAFCFLFSTTELNVGLDGQRDAGHSLPRSARLDQQMDLLRSHLAVLELEMPGLGARLGQPMRLSAAVFEATRLRLVRQCQVIIGQEFLDEEDTPVSKPLHRVVLGTDVWPDLDGAIQYAQICVYAERGPMTVKASARLPLGCPTALLTQAWREADVEHHTQEIVELPSVSRETVLRGSDGRDLTRNGVGNWVERKLLALGTDAEVLLTPDWESVLQAIPTQLPAQERDTLGRLPVPELLSQKLRFPDLVRQRYRADVAAFLEGLVAQPSVAYGTAVARLFQAFPQFSGLPPAAVHEAVPRPGMWSAWHFTAVQGRLFRVRDTLLQRLALTDVEHGLPASFVHSPYPDCYFTLQTPLSTEDGEYKVLGFYVSERHLTPQECEQLDQAAGTRVVAITLVHEEQDAFVSIEAMTTQWAFQPDDTSDFSETLEEVFQAARTGKGVRQGVPEAELKLQKDALLLACKVLLYVGLKNARLVDQPLKAALMSRVREAKGKEKDRLWARAQATCDYIDVGPEEALPEMPPSVSGHTDRTVRPHWRRGYYRPQAFGPGRSERRTVWIEPVLVRADRLTGGDEPPRPDYIVH